MKILVTGRGKGGSWEIRGEQLGRAIEATIDPRPSSVKGFDAVVVVKRPRPEVVQLIRQSGVPLVWDVVDAWPQPDGNDWPKAACMEWLDRSVDAIKPAGIVAATQVMAADCSHYTVPVLTLPHHARPGMTINPLRELVAVVGYQGGENLGLWAEILDRQCAARGWTFRPDHSKTADMQLADVDIVVAVRGQTGYAAQNWKSGVKLANAQGSGTPSIVSRSAGYVETASARQYYADDEPGMATAFDALASPERRREQVAKYRPPTLDHVAERYLDWLWRLIAR